MALSSTQYALFAAGLKIPSREATGVTHTVYGEFDASAMLGGSANGCVNMVVVPANTRFKDMQLEWGALGASTLLHVGDQFDCDRFMLRADGSIGSITQRNSQNLGASNCGRFNGLATSPSEQSVGYLFTCDTAIIVSNLSGSATGRIQLWVEYTHV